MYNALKNVFLAISGRRRQDIKALEKRISELILCMTSIHSWEEGIDQSLRQSVFQVESEEYKVMKLEISFVNKMYIMFVKRYTRLTNNQLSSSTELNATTMYLMIDQLKDLKSRMMTFDFWKLEKLTRDIAMLIDHAGWVLNKLRWSEDMITCMLKLNQDRLDDGGDDVLPVFNKYVAQVLDYLGERRNEVGIYGRKGVGKTTVLKKVYTRLIEWKCDGIRLDNIIWIEYPPEAAEINENDIIEKLQNEMMEQLQIHHEASSSIIKNANTISAFLREKRYILLMDNVSTLVDLDEVGLRNFHEHKKVVICSREKEVIRRMTEHEVKIETLEKDDAWRLFENISGKLYDRNKKVIADKIIEYCAGIPGMISVVAKYLKGKKDDSSWIIALDLLEREGFDKIYEIKYQGLPMHTKKCLLYGALFPHQYKINADHLIECWIAEGFIDEKAGQKVRLNRELGQTILNYLTDEGLLQWCSGKKYVMVPPDFRKVALELEFPGMEKGAIWVPSKDRMPDEETWTTVTRMSLIGGKTELPLCPQCPNLSTLLLQSMKLDRELLPDSFFINMESLQVLNLNDTGIRALPNSINKLVNLKSLYLNGCPRLKALPSEAANLVKLEFLDMCGTSIPTLPREIRWMVKMRCLRATLSPAGKEVEEIIAPGIISNLRNLEELSIITAFDFGIAAAHRLAEELASLEHLNTLCFNFPNVSSLNAFVTKSKALNNMETSWGTNTFRSFKIFVGCHEKRLDYEPDFSGILAERWLRYSTNEEFSPACQELLNQASAFEIIGHDGLKSFSESKFDLHSVKVWVVEHCRDLKNIIDGYEEHGFVKVNLLTDLEKLYLYDLEQLQCIWDGPVPPNGLVNLTAITIKGCHKLTEIIGPALARSLKSLEYLKVDDCRQISKIIEMRGGASEIEHVPEESSNSDLLKSLRKIELSNLPELESICWSDSSSMNWYSLRSIIIMRCNKLSNLCLTLTNATKLASIQCEKSWWDALITDEVKQHFLPVCCFKEEYFEGGDQPKEASSPSGRSEFIAGDNTSTIHSAPSDINADYEEEMPLSDNLQASQMDVYSTSINPPAPSDMNVDYEEEAPLIDDLLASRSDVHKHLEAREEINEDCGEEMSYDGNVLDYRHGKRTVGKGVWEESSDMPSISDANSSYISEYKNEQKVVDKFADVGITGTINFQEEGHYWVLEDNNHLKLRFDDRIILIGDYPPPPPPPPPPPDGSPVNAMLSLVDQDLHELPEKPGYRNSLILLLQRNKRLTLIRSSFFDSMPDLRFLDISNTKIRILPSSLFNLPKLKVLLLRNCICLDDLSPEIGKLITLEVLDLSGTELYDLPDEISRLAEVTSMHLSFYGPDDESEYEHLPSQLVSPQFLSELKRLQTLTVSVHPEDHRWTEIAAYIIEDMSKLEKLSYLECYFPQVEMFENFIQTSPSWEEQRLSKFNFIIGQNVKRIVSYVPEEVESLFSQEERCLRYVNGDKVSPLINTTLIRVTAFYLDHHTEVQSFSEFDVSNFRALKFCVVRECPKIKAILDEKNAGSAMFPHLEYLGIFFLWELEDIWKAPSQAGSVERNFEALRYLIIKTCPKIRFLLRESMLHCLNNLEELVVEDCEKMEKIIEEENEKVKYEINVLPGLRKLVLRYLPELVSLGCGYRMSEENISVYYCPKLIHRTKPVK